MPRSSGCTGPAGEPGTSGRRAQTPLGTGPSTPAQVRECGQLSPCSRSAQASRDCQGLPVCVNTSCQQLASRAFCAQGWASPCGSRDVSAGRHCHVKPLFVKKGLRFPLPYPGINKESTSHCQEWLMQRQKILNARVSRKGWCTNNYSYIISALF